jgi:hypothetical protein
VEDYLVVISWVWTLLNHALSKTITDILLKLLVIVLTVLACKQTQYGLGHHIYDIPPWADAVVQKYNYITQLLYTIVLCTIKLSICFFYLRIFHVEKRMRWLIHACIWFLIVYSLVFEFISMFQCHPIHAFWDFAARATGGTCLNTIPAFYASGACNITSDLLLMAIVVPKIRELRIKRGQKIVIVCIVSLGWLAVAASVLRVVRLSTLLHSPDPSWASYDITIWSAVEINTGIICASAPAIKPLLATVMPKFMAKLSSNRSQDYTKNYASDSFPAIEMS